MDRLKILIMSDYIKKPPLGLRPRLFHNEQRYQEVIQAISRYWNADMPLPIEWITEYNELLAWLKENESTVLNQ